MTEMSPDEKYRLVAMELFKLNVERLKAYMSVQADYGKWLISTLAVIHSGALYAIANSKLYDYIGANSVPFLVGLLLTFASGLATWTNFSLAIVSFDNWADPGVIIDAGRWPRPNPKLDFWIKATMTIAIIMGVASMVCIVWGLVFIHH